MIAEEPLGDIDDENNIGRRDMLWPNGDCIRKRDERAITRATVKALRLCRSKGTFVEQQHRDLAIVLTEAFLNTGAAQYDTDDLNLLSLAFLAGAQWQKQSRAHSSKKD